MLRLYRELEKGEFLVLFGDCAQGGSDSNFVTGISKSRIDIPLVIKMQGVAAELTPVLHQALEWIYDKTGVQPVVALERQNGGSSEMVRLIKLNRQEKYRIYYMKDKDGTPDMNKPGWDTNSETRPRMIGDWKIAYDNRHVQIYDKDILEQHQTFITNKRGRPEAAPNAHDDGVMSPAGAWQLYQTEIPLTSQKLERTRPAPKRVKFHI